ncbi:tetratricopeptide repeat protein [Celeribacter sp. SCSIO 80788]|uniref:tetratricopeptide repeat protein n=1 Tax=Celeribacter sp. SCSIO 80788 TaxID=3117013 RepID=UPI003DA25417
MAKKLLNLLIFYRETRLVSVLPLAFCALFVLASQLSAQEDGVHVQEGLVALNAQDFAGAAAAFQEAFDDGDADGAFYLGRMLELGIGGIANPKAAVALYRVASELGSAQAMNRLGVLHIQGLGVLQNYEEGARLVCAAAELGDTNGAFNCGTVLREGVGTGKDEDLAYDWFAKAGDQGHLGAMNARAAALIEGKYVAQDIPAAMSLLEHTANRGDRAGLFALAQLQAAGLAGDADLIEAHKNFNLAAVLGHPRAAAARAAVEAGMSAEDVALAQERAQAWRPVELPKEKISEEG